MSVVIGLPRGLAMRAAVIGILAGAAYAWSPLTVCFFAATALLLYSALHDLAGRERTWIAAILSLAIGLRLVAVVFLVLRASATLSPVVSFFGDEFYLKRRAWWLRNLWSHISIGPLYFSVSSSDYGWTGYHYVLALTQMIVGPAPFGVHLVSIASFMAGAILLYRLARSAFGRAAALAGLIVVCFWPTLFMWSAAVLKESFQLLLSAMLLVASVNLFRSRRWPWLVLNVAAAAIAMLGLWTLRAGALTGAVLGLAAGLALAAILSRWEAAAVTIVGGLCATALVLARQELWSPILRRLQEAAMVHIGNVNTPGHAYTLLDQRLYVEGVYRLFTMTPGETARYVIRAVTAFVLVPLPWELASRAELAILPQQLAWYVLVGLAAIGVAAGLRRSMLVTSVLVAYAATTAGIIALHDGNIGTLVRHRDAVVPFVAWLSAVGAVAALTGGVRKDATCG